MCVCVYGIQQVKQFKLVKVRLRECWGERRNIRHKIIQCVQHGHDFYSDWVQFVYREDENILSSVEILKNGS